MSNTVNAKTNLENFDDLMVGDPATIEKNFWELLPEAKARTDKTIYLQILSQIALVQAMQKKFDDAHHTLDEAEKVLLPQYVVAKARILLERGRVHHQTAMFGATDSATKTKNMDEARAFFKRSFEFSEKNGLDFHTANAAHMMGIAGETVQDKIKWNEIAIKYSEKSKDEKAKAWLSALYNNLGQNYLEIHEFDKALPLFERALELRKKEGLAVNIRVAEWAVAHTLRLLERFEESLEILRKLCKEYEKMSREGAFDVHEEVIKQTRGFVFEDLAELYTSLARKSARQAYQDLSGADWIKLDEYKHRLDRLKAIQNPTEN